MKDTVYFLVDKDVLPQIYSKVILAKQYLANAEASSMSEAARMAGISRSVFYKYKDAVYPYQKQTVNPILTVQMILFDRPGVLMDAVSVFYQVGANILTINQNIPVNGKALVSISARIDNMSDSVEDLLSRLREIEGIQSIENISGE